MNTLLIANTLISKMHSYNKIIRPMKLQKLLFYSMGFYHKEYKKDLLDDNFLHYQYGPVIPLVYNIFSSYGGMPIKSCAVFNLENDNKKWILSYTNETSQVHQISDTVISTYACFTDLILSKKTHELSCWKNTSDYEVMEKDKIYEDFENLKYGE